MNLVYQIGIYGYYCMVSIASLFNRKAKLWINGRKDVFNTLEQQLKNNDQIYWFHCASLGEFEQGKPLIDKIKFNIKNSKILVTFFSPSGYELRKDYENADYVVYLPIDSKKNAHRFLDLVQPQQVFFIKYEFWFHYLKELNTRNIPTYLIAGVFRKDQLFFKWYGASYRRMLSFFTHFFVQNISSANLLQQLNIDQVTVSGDTRLDRVYDNSLTPKNVPLIKTFRKNKKIIVLGSSWLQEEKIITEFINVNKNNFKFIIAPHDTSKNRIQKIKHLLQQNYICYSDANSSNVADKKTLIIDHIGILSNIYQYSDIALIGGGFSGALHNILEPASFNNVVLFGPKHVKFHEAEDLIKIGAAFSISDIDDFIAIINRLLLNNHLISAQTSASNYIKEGIGASTMILDKIGITS